MRKRTKLLIVACVLSFGLAANYWQSDIQKVVIESAELSDADYYFEQVSVKKYDQQGNLASRLSAKKMEHYRSSDHSAIVQPEILIISDKGSAWKIESKSGELHHKNNVLTLQTDTQLSQLNEENSNRLSSQDLTVHFDEKLATTQNPVSIDSGSSVTKASGMDANLDSEQITLHGPVSTEGKVNE